MTGERFDVLYEGFCDGSLGSVEREEFLAALGDPAWRARFVELSAFAALVSDELGMATTEEKVSTRSLRAIRAARRPRTTSPSLAPWIAAGAAAAALLIMIALGFSAGSRPPKPVKPVEVRMPEPRRETVQVEAPPSAPPAPRREEREPEPLVVPPVPPPTPPKPTKPPDPVVPPPKPAPPPAPAPAPKAPEKETVAAIAHVEAVLGKVSVAGAEAVGGLALRGEETIETAPGAAAWIRFPDGTRLTLGPDALIARVSEANGKAIQVDRGTLWVDAPKQPRPLTVSGPHAEAVVLGTEFSYAVGAGFTRLDVREGRVRFSRGVSSVVVGPGQYAIALAGQDLAVKPGPSLWKAPPGGLLSWLKGDAVKMGGKGVAAWLDQSSSGNHGSQPAPGCQPMLVDGLRPALKFDGSDDFFELPSGMSEFRGGLSAFVVARVASAPATCRFIDLGAGPSCDNVVFGRKDGALAFWAYANGQTRGKIEVPGAVAVDQLAVYAVVAQSNGRATLYRNGAPVGAGTTSPLPGEARKPNYVGKSNYAGEPPFRGEIAELLLYQRAVTDPERQHIDGYLWAKYLDPTQPAVMPRPAAK